MKTRFRIIGGLVLLAAIVVGVVLLLLPSTEQENAATVVEVVNKVDAHPRPKDDWQPAVLDMAIYGGGQVRTGAASSAQLELLEGMVRLSADSILTVKESAARQGKLVTTLFLQQGRLWAHLTTGQSHEFAVQTGNAVAAVRDTRFSVRVSAGETLLSVAEGEVVLTAQGTSVTLGQEEQVTVEAGRPPSPPEPMSDEERALWAIEGQMPELAPPTPTPVPPTPTLTPTPTPAPTFTPLPVGEIDISGCNNESDGEIEIDANREYIAITRPGCWASPDEAWESRSSVQVSMTVDGIAAPFVGFGPTAECLPGGISTGTYNFGAYYRIGPFTAGDYTVETIHTHDGEGEINNEVCVLHVR